MCGGETPGGRQKKRIKVTKDQEKEEEEQDKGLNKQRITA